MAKLARKIAALLLVLSSFGLMATGTKISFVHYTLPNGLNVILHQDNSKPVVAVTILYHVGSKNESADRTGFAHFFEHLMFEGSENIPRGQYDKITQNAGGVNNANTSQDRTFYYELLPSNQLELGLWLESERLMHLKVDSVGVETQRKVVKEERSSRYDNQPYGSIIEETFKRAFRVHPYHWIPIGSVQYIDEAKLSEFMDFYRTYYVPDNATLSIAGDIDIETTKQLVSKYFAGIPKGKIPIVRPQVKEPPQQAEIRDVVYDNIQLPAVIQAYQMPAMGTPDYYALDMLTRLLSSGESSRLVKAVVDQQQKALFAGAFPFALEDAGLFIVFSIANMGISPEDVEAAINTEVEKVISGDVTDKDLQKLKNQVENEFVNQNASMAGIAENLANYHVYFGDANLINTEIERYNKVTREDLLRVAGKYLRKENRLVLYYLPKSEKK
ncbi:MAG TPA: pitrilysin family protein [Bacteroidales bacterium]|nr:pitrilysin family protein [Bacteroidales bacterium]HSA43996.1 pitrilysin family protein [Bacteroidales bacterium]